MEFLSTRGGGDPERPFWIGPLALKLSDSFSNKARRFPSFVPAAPVPPAVGKIIELTFLPCWFFLQVFCPVFPPFHFSSYRCVCFSLLFPPNVFFLLLRDFPLPPVFCFFRLFPTSLWFSRVRLFSLLRIFLSFLFFFFFSLAYPEHFLPLAAVLLFFFRSPFTFFLGKCFPSCAPIFSGG